ncbi:amidohydrolase family protein [Natronomonas sp. CBA1123]|uniref:amidohydrolase n=1 Tax=Natronomonas sp. CBA1123 TaxID=2668070 RepID=UPI0012EA5DA2|nr:amidohydrolase [Natronomonas sp. CBA1123]MUV87707.1 amidohydrolase family protein [Natronomonas sp. CBA1123]
MTQAADRIFTNAEVHTLADPDETHEAVAVRDGRTVRVDSAYEIGFLEGVDTEVIDCDGGVLLPGFIDAHTHMEIVGRRLVHADLAVDDRETALDRLREAPAEEWILGYGYDESVWDDDRYLTREELDSVYGELPVVAFREDLHTASVNSVVLERYGESLPEDGVERDGDEPTGVVTEDAAEFLRMETAPGRAETKRLVEAARDRAHRLGVTGVHDMVRHSDAPAAYRALARDGDLDLRVRLYYWADHLDAVEETGLATNHGGPFVEVGGIKTYTDGSLGAGTAKLSEPYTDREGTGEWVVDPEELADIAERTEELGMQLAVHAIGDEAIDVALETLPEDPEMRHRIEHAELLPADLEGFDAVASMQPNFLRWAREGGLYERRLGAERTAESNRFADVLDAGVPLAFGSDCMPLDPLFGVQQAVTAPEEGQRLSVTEALEAYTSGAAYAGHDEDRFGTVEVGKRADFVVLEESPWAVDVDAIADIAVAMTVVDGEVVYRA